MIFLIWPLGGLVSEYSQLIAADSDTPTLLASLKNEVLSWVRSDTPSTYRADLFNTVDMLSLHLLLASYIAYYVAPAAYLPLRAFAVLALNIRLRTLLTTHRLPSCQPRARRLARAHSQLAACMRSQSACCPRACMHRGHSQFASSTSRPLSVPWCCC